MKHFVNSDGFGVGVGVGFGFGFGYVFVRQGHVTRKTTQINTAIFHSLTLYM